jgi:hypothetical protein
LFYKPTVNEVQHRTGKMLESLEQRLKSLETIISLIGIATASVIGVLGIVATVAPERVMGVTIAVAALGFAILVLFLVLLIFSADSQWRIPNGPFRVLSSSLHWNILSQDGNEAILEKSRTLEFTQNNVMAIREYVATDGAPPTVSDFEVFAEGCSPEVVRIRKEGMEWHVLVSLNAIFHRGNTLKITTKRKIKGAFKNSEEEYVAVRIPEPTDVVMACVTLPLGVRVKHDTLNIKSTSHRGASPTKYLSTREHIKPDPVTARQQIIWTHNRPVCDRRYILSWQWEGIVVPPLPEERKPAEAQTPLPESL